MSQTTAKLVEFAARLARDGYPTHLIERAAERMADMEDIIVENAKVIRFLNDKVEFTKGYLNSHREEFPALFNLLELTFEENERLADLLEEASK